MNDLPHGKHRRGGIGAAAGEGLAEEGGRAGAAVGGVGGDVGENISFWRPADGDGGADWQ